MVSSHYFTRDARPAGLSAVKMMINFQAHAPNVDTWYSHDCVRFRFWFVRSLTEDTQPKIGYTLQSYMYMPPSCDDYSLSINNTVLHVT